MERYESYKDSGVAWIGQVPSHWIHSRIKFCLSRSVAGIWGDDEKGNKDDIVCFRVADFDYSKGCLTFDKLTIRNVSAAQLQNRLLHDEDLLIEKSGGGDATPVGRVVRFNYNDKAICSNFIHSISVKEGYSSNYLYYYFYGMYANKVNLLYFNQTTGIQNLKVGEYLSQTIYLPTLVEQQAIAAYLDKRCCEIDKAIATQQKRIALLQELKQSIITHAVTRGIHPDVPLKESGVEWIGKVPEHWDIKRMRFLCTIDTGTRDTIDKVDDGDYPFYVRSPKIERINTYTFDGEAVLMAGDGVGAGKVIHYANGKFDYHQRVYNIHNYREIATLFAYYYLQSNFRYKIEEGGAKNTVDSVRLPWLKDFPVCIPPQRELDEILTFIKKNNARINTLILKAERQIELLQELRQSVITEAITGKIKVC